MSGHRWRLAWLSWVSVSWVPALALAGDPAPDDLIGRIVPPYPAGLEEVGGSCVAGGDGHQHVCDYSIAVWASTPVEPGEAPDYRYLVAGRLAGRDSQQARWQITDVLPYPVKAPGYHLQIGSCRQSGVDASGLLAIVGDDWDKEMMARVAWAGHLRLPEGKFDPIPAKGVDCYNEGYGEGI